mgnify:CR=1 FL=1
MEKIKLEEKELKEIKQIREENSRMVVDFGRIKVELIMLQAKVMEMQKIEDEKDLRINMVMV